MTGEGVLVDPVAVQVERDVELIKELGVRLKYAGDSQTYSLLVQLNIHSPPPAQSAHTTTQSGIHVSSSSIKPCLNAAALFLQPAALMLTSKSGTET